MDKQKSKITSVKEAIDSIRGLPMDMVFRGQVNSTWAVQPALLRNEMSYKWNIYEEALISYLSTNKKDIPFLQTGDPFEYFAILQHFGLPTRMLDITDDIYTALFFSCYDPSETNSNSDGALFLIRKDLFYNEQLVKAPDLSNETDVAILRNRMQFTDIRLITPFAKNIRLRAQHGQFLCFPLGSIIGYEDHYATLNEFATFSKNELRRYLSQTQPTKDWSHYNPCLLSYVTIHKDYKKSILRQLDEDYGINENTIFTNNKYTLKEELFFIKLYNWAIQQVDIMMPIVDQSIRLREQGIDPLNWALDEYMKQRT